ncbi:MAG TPA: phenylalanine 4-monooxygenase [Planctomycetes bacterium]|nr:phenylalanine 4-monooxygenase [Planctomycetota bacterium]
MPRLVELDRDHPGFRDPGYRERRDAIAEAALNHRGGPPPQINYTQEENRVWSEIWTHLAPLHQRFAPAGYRSLCSRLGFEEGRIPQMRDINERLLPATGFQMQPVAGLIEASEFLTQLGGGVFLATQYVRHPSTPLYTPEPDVVHEVVGHAASFLHPGIADLNRMLGRAAQGAPEPILTQIERVYWWTMEFGALIEDGHPRAFGAGLLSSFGEIRRLEEGANLLDFDVEAMASRDYDPTDYQPVIFVASCWEEFDGKLREWLGGRA